MKLSPLFVYVILISDGNIWNNKFFWKRKEAAETQAMLYKRTKSKIIKVRMTGV